MNDLFFTSDTHFGHTNIIEYCDRPFANAEEMDDALVENWNNVVGPTDTVWVLGDFSFRNAADTRAIVQRLNGHKKLILGNHDKVIHENRSTFCARGAFEEITELKMIHGPGQDRKQKIVLCHYPMRAWNQSHRGSWQLFGHMHGTPPDNLDNLLSIDVGVDSHEYTPVGYDVIREIMRSK